MTIISNDKGRLKKRSDTIGTLKGLDPFIYYFKNDSLKLYYKDEITYRINSKFKTIRVFYFVLDSEKYYALKQNSYENINFHSVPHRPSVPNKN
jgi:hypothetical protein